MSTITNHFGAIGQIVEGTDFIGREIELDIINQTINREAKGNVSIVGIPKVGKSSLMYTLVHREDELWRENQQIVIWYTFKKNSTSARDLFIALASRTYSFLEDNQADEAFLVKIKRQLDILFDPESLWIEFEEAILNFFTRVVKKGYKVIYCIDEFDYSKEILHEDEYELLRELSYVPRNRVAIITTSRRSLYDIEHYSGGGSNFYSTCEPIYLKPFSKEEAALQCKLVPDIEEKTINEVYEEVGGHPFLSACILSHFDSKKKIQDTVSEVKQTIIKYYDDLFYVLKKDHLDDKVDKLFCGFEEFVSQGQEDYIYNCYGIFSKDEDGYVIPFSDSFEVYLNNRYRNMPFHDTWPKAENSIRKAISYALSEEYGEGQYSRWLSETCDRSEFSTFSKSRWRNQLEKERRYYDNASPNFVNQVYPAEYATFFQIYWNDYLKQIFGKNLPYWLGNLTFIADRVRNIECHSRKGLLSGDEQLKATTICQEITLCVDSFFTD